MALRFHSVWLEVADWPSAVRDYTTLLGVGPVVSEASGAPRGAVFELGNLLLEIREADEGADPQALGVGGLRFASDAPPDPAAWAAEAQPPRRIAAEGESDGALRAWSSWRLAASHTRAIPIELVTPCADEADEGQPASKPSIDGVTALDHVVVMSRDPDGTRSVYGEEGLGLRLALDRSFEKRGVRLLFFRLEGRSGPGWPTDGRRIPRVTVEVGARLAERPRPDEPDRFGGLAWKVASIEAIQARLAGTGFDVSEVRDGHKPGTRVCTVRAPVHGVPTLLIEPVD